MIGSFQRIGAHFKRSGGACDVKNIRIQGQVN
jgi:hypothetical protein